MNSILGIVDLTKINTLPELYNTLVSLKKDVYNDHERIIIRHGNHTDTVSLIKEILEFIDIPEFFVLYEFIDSNQGLNFNLKPSHCIYPWINLMVNNDGDVRPCCAYHGNISNDDKSATKILDKNIKDIYLSEYMQALRLKFLAGEYPSECSSCWKNEQVGAPSMRQGAKHKFKDIYYTIDYQVEDFKNLQIFDLKLGNSCNLSCNICNPVSSSSIAKKELEAKVITIHEYNKIKEDSSWVDSELFWEQMTLSINNIKYLDLYGGEPLMSKPHFKFLKRLIDAGVAHTIKLDYNTNGTVYSEAFFDLWDLFKEVKLSFSIDDIEERFESQRCGAKWNNVVDNITKYNLKKSNKFITEVYPTINTQNVYWLPELIEWIKTQNFDHVSFNLLETPIEFNITSLDKTTKIKIVEKFQQNISHEILNSVIKLLDI